MLYLHGVALLVLPEAGGHVWLAGDGGQLSPEQQGLCFGLGRECALEIRGGGWAVVTGEVGSGASQV